MFFLRKNLVGERSCLKIVGLARGVAEETRTTLIKMPPMTKICQKSLVSSFSVSLVFLRTSVQAYYSN